MVTPAARREAAAHLQKTYAVSQRRACSVLKIDRSSTRYRRRRPDDAPLRAKIRELAAERRRFGYRRIHLMLERQGVVMNQKKLRRLYREERLQVKRRGGRKRALGTRAPIALPDAPNQRWSLDFVSDAFTDGRRFRIFALSANERIDELADLRPGRRFHAGMPGAGGRHVDLRQARGARA